MKKHFTAHVIFAATSLMSQQAWALGFGRVVSDAVLGQTLTAIVPVHGDAGERFGNDCVSAEVYFGESRLMPNTVRTAVEQGSGDNEWLVRITTTSPVEEPVVEIALSAGCGRRFVRRFTAFADPPTLATPAAQLAQVQPDDAPSTASALEPVARASAPSGASARRHRAAHAASAGGTHVPGVVRKGPTMALANELSLRGEDRAGGRATAAAPGRTPSRVAPAAAEASRLVLDGGFAHLKLDIDDPIVPPAGSATVAAAASIALSELDDPDARKLRSLEQSIQAVRRDSQANRDQAARLQAELAEAQAHGDLLPYVLGLLALAVAAAAALAWKLRQQSRLQAHSAWFESQQGLLDKEPAVPPPAPRPTVVVSAPVVPREAGPSIGGELVGPDSSGFGDTGSMGDAIVAGDVSATQPLSRGALAGVIAQEAAAPREMAVEELLDLEQQADFFIALGQEDAAVDLLMSHLRSAGGQSPLPYTKLLEIYKRQGDRSAYERTRARFNRRFNAYAPDWDVGPSSGRSLEDYPETVAQVQGVWNSPIDAMAVLEALLFKRDDSSELFDLPAYRDVLVLYSLARDLWQQEGGPAVGAAVDVLLPLDDAEFDEYVPQGAAGAAGSDLDLPIDAALPTSYDLQEFQMSGGQGHDQGPGAEVDLEMPLLDELAPPRAAAAAGKVPAPGDDVHVTLEPFSLAPIEPTPPPPSPLDWDIGLDDPKAPGKR